MKLRVWATPVVIGALALGAAACGSSSDSSSTAAKSSPPAAAKPVAQINNLSGASTQLALNPAFVKALTSLKVTPAPVGNATISKAGVASFPITGGSVTYFKPGTHTPYVESSIDHNGSGLSLTAGGKTVELTNFVVDAGKSTLTGKVSLNGKTVGTNVLLFYLDGRTLKPLQAKSNGTAVLAGTVVRLSAPAAALLNKTFGVTALTKNLPIGIAKITVNTK